MKSAIYGTLTGLLNAKNVQTGGTIVKMASDLLQESLLKHQWRNVKLLLRFFGELVNSNVILPTTLLNVMDQFLNVLQEDTILRVRDRRGPHPMTAIWRRQNSLSLTIDFDIHR